MAIFDIGNHLSDGRSLRWLAVPEGNETAQDVEALIRAEACKKFGNVLFFKPWRHVQASNGYVSVWVYVK